MTAFLISTLVVLGAPVPLLSPGTQFALHSRIPDHVFRIFSHDNITEPIRTIVLSATTQYNMTTLFVTFKNARVALKQCGALGAFDDLIPGAYKADLLRYCLVWLHGGWYADLSANFVGDPRPLSRDSDLVVANDPGAAGAIWNGLFAARPRHPGMRAAIDTVIANVNSCFYGTRDLAPTGPMLFGRVLQPYSKRVIPAHYHGERMHLGNPDLVHNKFEGYRAVYAQMGYNKDTASYGHLYDARHIYRHCT